MIRIMLTLLPFAWMVLCLPFVNRVYPIVLGMPFIAFWIEAGIFVTVICLHTLYKMDTKREQEANSNVQ